MHTTVYILNKPVYLCDELDSHLQQLHHQPETVFIDELNAHTVKTMLREIALPDIKQGIFLHPDLEALKKQFFKKFTRHVAAGGLALNPDGELLLIYRKGFWDLPKGHLEKGETLEECALREVQEETGLLHLRLSYALCTSYHTYEHGTHHILKESHWFVMDAAGSQPLLPQIEEGIERIEWVPIARLKTYLDNAYPSIREVIALFLTSRI